MEKVQDQPQTLEVFENDIALYLSEFCQEQGIEDIKKESQSVWNGALMYIRRHVFADPQTLRTAEPLEGYENNTYNNKYSNLNKSTCNRYDIDKVNMICDYYIYMCNVYDKEISIIGFCKLTGITQECIFDWARDERRLSPSGFEIYKKLSEEREESLSNKLVTGKQNPVGVLGVLNRHYAWNMPGVRQDSGGKRSMGLEEIRNQLKELSGEGQKAIESQEKAVNKGILL